MILVSGALRRKTLEPVCGCEASLLVRFSGAGLCITAGQETHLSVFTCPSTPDPQRLQNKNERPPEQDKMGACGDYFVTEGVNIAINNELAAAERFSVSADLRGAMRRYPEQNTFAKIKDGTSTTILVAECAGREDVWCGWQWNGSQC